MTGSAGAYSDAKPAPPLHEVGCIDWCAHCALCGVPVLYGARCQDHYGVYPGTPTIQEFRTKEDR